MSIKYEVHRNHSLRNRVTWRVFAVIEGSMVKYTKLSSTIFVRDVSNHIIVGCITRVI